MPVEMPISHESPSTAADATRYNVRAFVRLANRRSSSPIAPSLGTTDHLPADQTSNRERGESADKRTIACGDKASCCGQQPPGPDQTKEISCSAVKEEGHGKPVYKSPPLPYIHPSTELADRGIMRSGTAQSFLESIDIDVSTRNGSRHQLEDPPDVGSCSCCCRCGRVQKWRLGPRARRSRSNTALRTGISELSGWEGEPTKVATVETPNVVKSFEVGQSPLEMLPTEILGKNPEGNSTD